MIYQNQNEKGGLLFLCDENWRICHDLWFESVLYQIHEWQILSKFAIYRMNFESLGGSIQHRIGIRLCRMQQSCCECEHVTERREVAASDVWSARDGYVMTSGFVECSDTAANAKR